MLVLSDYSGSHRASLYDVTSVLVMDMEASAEWEAKRQWIRRYLLPNGRRLSFKSLGDRKRSRALQPFLAAADTIRGICLTIAVTKAIRRTQRVLESHCDSLPSAGDIEDFHQRIEDLQIAWDGLKGDELPASVLPLLRGAAAEEGAPLSSELLPKQAGLLNGTERLKG